MLPTRTVEGSGFLAQASVSRLGKISSNLPKLLTQAVAQVRRSYFEREPISPKREDATTPLFLDSSSRLGEGSSLERGKPLA